MADGKDVTSGSTRLNNQLNKSQATATPFLPSSERPPATSPIGPNPTPAPAPSPMPPRTDQPGPVPHKPPHPPKDNEKPPISAKKHQQAYNEQMKRMLRKLGWSEAQINAFINGDAKTRNEMLRKFAPHLLAKAPTDQKPSINNSPAQGEVQNREAIKNNALGKEPESAADRKKAITEQARQNASNGKADETKNEKVATTLRTRGVNTDKTTTQGNTTNDKAIPLANKAQDNAAVEKIATETSRHAVLKRLFNNNGEKRDIPFRPVINLNNRKVIQDARALMHQRAAQVVTPVGYKTVGGLLKAPLRSIAIQRSTLIPKATDKAHEIYTRVQNRANAGFALHDKAMRGIQLSPGERTNLNNFMRTFQDQNQQTLRSQAAHEQMHTSHLRRAEAEKQKSILTRWLNLRTAQKGVTGLGQADTEGRPSARTEEVARYRKGEATALSNLAKAGRPSIEEVDDKKNEPTQLKNFREDAILAKKIYKDLEKHIKSGKLNPLQLPGMVEQVARELGMTPRETKALRAHISKLNWDEALLGVSRKEAAFALTAGGLKGGRLHGPDKTSETSEEERAKEKINPEPQKGLSSGEVTTHWTVGRLILRNISAKPASVVDNAVKSLRSLYKLPADIEQSDVEKTARGLGVSPEKVKAAFSLSHQKFIKVKQLPVKAFLKAYGPGASARVMPLKLKGGGIGIEVHYPRGQSPAQRAQALSQQSFDIQALFDQSNNEHASKLTPDNLSGWDKKSLPEKVDIKLAELHIIESMMQNQLIGNQPGIDKDVAQQRLNRIQEQITDLSRSQEAAPTPAWFNHNKPPSLFAMKTPDVRKSSSSHRAAAGQGRQSKTSGILFPGRQVIAGKIAWKESSPDLIRWLDPQGFPHTERLRHRPSLIA